jgi:ADP-ribosylglycohydrolase
VTSILYDRIYAVNAVAPIANSMGDLTEGMHWREVEEKYGFLQELLPQTIKARSRKSEWGRDFVYQAMDRPPGQTEDGQERHRLVCEAIIRKNGRINAADLGRAWVDLINPENFGKLLGPQDQIIYWSLYAGMPTHEVGRYAAWPKMHGTSKMIQPIGLVNACNPAQAAADAHDVGRIKDVSGFSANFAIEVAAALAAGCAHAVTQGASVGSVIDTALAQLSPTPRAEVEQGLEWAREGKDWKKLRENYAERYKYANASDAVEVLSSSLAVFYLCDGDAHQGMLWAVNMGRDTDDRAYDVACLSTALNGLGTFPREWIDTVENQLKTDTVTVSNRSLKETADGLYKATLNELEKSKSVMRDLEKIL